MPQVVRRIKRTAARADQIAKIEGDTGGELAGAPIVADGEAGFGSAQRLRAAEVLIAAGVAGPHWEDQLAQKKCGHLGGKVLIRDPAAHPSSARLASMWLMFPRVVIARTDAEAAADHPDVDERDQPLITGERNLPHQERHRALYRSRKAYAPFADLIYGDRRGPEAARSPRRSYGVPDQMLAYNCSPSSN